MAIQVNGNLLNGFQQYQNPKIELVPHLQYRGQISLDAHIVIVETIAEATEETPAVTQSHQVGTIQQQNVLYPLIAELQYTNNPVDPYADLIDALENYVITKLSETNPTCSFNKV